MTGPIHKLVTGRSLAVSLLGTLLVFTSVAQAADPLSGLALVRRELPELVAAFEAGATQAEMKALFGNWTSGDVEEFRLKNYGLDEAVAEHAGKWTAESVIAMREKFGRQTSGTLGEVWGVAELRSQAESGLQVLHESNINLGTDNGHLVDGLVYETRGNEIILHSLIESKMGASRYLPSQTLGFLANIKKGGITVGEKKYSPAQVYLFHGGKKHALRTAKKGTLESFNVHLVTQRAKEIGAVTQLPFPLDSNRTKSSLDLFYGRIANLKGNDLEEYLAFYRQIEKHRKRIQDLGELLGHRGGIFHTLFPKGSVKPQDYSSSKTRQEPVHRISRSIMDGKMNLPEAIRGLIEPEAFLDANDAEALAMKEAILKIRPQDPLVVSNRRRRIQELGELLGYRGRIFHNLFTDGSVGKSDYGNIKKYQEPVHVISRAILEGKMNLPQEFQGLIKPADLKAFLDANGTEASAMKEAILLVQRQKLAVLKNRRRRIQELGELLGYTRRRFHTLFPKDLVNPNDYDSMRNSQDAVHCISRAIMDGKMTLPEAFRGLIDTKAFLDANDAEASSMKEAILKIRPLEPLVIENRRRRIQELGELLGYRGGNFHTLFPKDSVEPNDYRALKDSLKAVNRISGPDRVDR